MNKLSQINEYTYNLLGEFLFETVPEFKNTFESKFKKNEILIGGYSFMNEFALILVEEMRKNMFSNFVADSFKYINTIAENENLEILNVLKIGILEILYTSEASLRDNIFNLLSKRCQIFFKSFENFYT